MEEHFKAEIDSWYKEQAARLASEGECSLKHPTCKGCMDCSLGIGCICTNRYCDCHARPDGVRTVATDIGMRLLDGERT